MTAIIDRRVETPPQGVKLPPSSPQKGTSWLPLMVAYLAGVLSTLLVVWWLTPVKPQAVEKPGGSVNEPASPQVAVTPKPTLAPVARTAAAPGVCAGQCRFEGTLNKPLGTIAAGTPFQGTFTWEAANAPGTAIASGVVDYRFKTLTLTVGDTVINHQAGGSFRVIDNANDGTNKFDSLGVYATGVDAKLGGLTLDPAAGILVSLRDQTATLFENTELPKEIDGSRFGEDGTSVVEFRIAGTNAGIQGTIRKVTAVQQNGAP